MKLSSIESCVESKWSCILQMKVRTVLLFVDVGPKYKRLSLPSPEEEKYVSRKRGMWSNVQVADGCPAPSSRSKHAMCVSPTGSIYLLGGRSANLPLKDLWKFDPGKL
ncbi:uncharacterized protein TNIN_444701 [Trichonephila inaurata madagascariensis]|uniref:Uncharacterized protein n=1 Tax=Trichonephila inaurata madagascariensis TaxID=2747483 RepID=A0A8X7C173_9ARAC|nr:uncharacterized protein TNIN_444701 [Trichonephila inaurata madagascariensis]